MENYFKITLKFNDSSSDPICISLPEDATFKNLYDIIKSHFQKMNKDINEDYSVLFGLEDYQFKQNNYNTLKSKGVSKRSNISLARNVKAA
jgi:hypothetical protein